MSPRGEYEYEGYDYFLSDAQEKPQGPQSPDESDVENEHSDAEWDNETSEQDELSEEFYTYQLATESLDMEDYVRFGFGSAEWDREYELLVMALTGRIDYSLPWYPNNN